MKNQTIRPERDAIAKKYRPLSEPDMSLARDVLFSEHGTLSLIESAWINYGVALEKYNQAALQTAQTTVRHAVELDFKQASELLELFGGEPTAYTVSYETGGHSGPGIYAHVTEYPEEGSSYLGETEIEAVPDAQPASDLVERLDRLKKPSLTFLNNGTDIRCQTEIEIHNAAIDEAIRELSQ